MLQRLGGVARRCLSFCLVYQGQKKQATFSNYAGIKGGIVSEFFRITASVFTFNAELRNSSASSFGINVSTASLE